MILFSLQQTKSFTTLHKEYDVLFYGSKNYFLRRKVKNGL